ncbi:hypothetical protein NG798_04390 [Ancylothrix sp. C2]|uniref:hypothetical protein n=1 Tax=Ancylothrix sp. D3o TaxID=2953691 RepID=UPI0021BB2565|nr:hypothetical protein [Ancylothrix sp. D3o]MCT7949017.1 hypothetical protein [Ancylothrix sp. D3o]
MPNKFELKQEPTQNFEPVGEENFLIISSFFLAPRFLPVPQPPSLGSEFTTI